MKTENWIKIDRSLDELKYPCWLLLPENKQRMIWSAAPSRCGTEAHWWLATHYIPIEVPDAPKEPSREDLDAREFENARKGFPLLDGDWYKWLRALRYERSFIRHFIDRHKSGELPGPEVIRQITERVKL